MSKLVVAPVRTPTEKLEAVARIATEQFHGGERLLILVENEKVSQFIDDLLWKIPSDSFLPHVVATTSVDEPIVITEREENLNRARALLSLLPVVSRIAGEFELIYDLDDLTSDAKKEQSIERRRAYVAMGVTD